MTTCLHRHSEFTGDGSGNVHQHFNHSCIYPRSIFLGSHFAAVYVSEADSSEGCLFF